MADTPHLLLPYLDAAQAQKHVTVNEALRLLDAVVQLSVKDRDLTAPPGSPAEGDRYIVASGATAAWSAWDLNIAARLDGAWTKLVPREGWLAHVDDEDIYLRWTGSAWETLRARPMLTIGGTLTIASGVVTASQAYHTIDTEAAAASDNLDTINGAAAGLILVVRAANDARTVVAKDGTGNLRLANDFSMNSDTDALTLFSPDGTIWIELCRSDNAS
jgi:hypothetical protein